jgi:hypothetical protein
VPIRRVVCMFERGLVVTRPVVTDMVDSVVLDSDLWLAGLLDSGLVSRS